MTEPRCKPKKLLQNACGLVVAWLPLNLAAFSSRYECHVLSGTGVSAAWIVATPAGEGADGKKLALCRFLAWGCRCRAQRLGCLVGGIEFFSSDLPRWRAARDCLSYDVIRSSVTSWVLQAADWCWSAAESANHWAALIAAVFTVVLVIYTARLWWSTNRLWNVTNKTLEHAEGASKKELRAYSASNRSE